MQESGGRRICRSILIDVHSVRFLDQELLERLQEVAIFKDRFLSSYEEVMKHNKDSGVQNSGFSINGRGLTNIGQFRAYVENYLRAHPEIHQEMTLLVRQCAPGAQGIPLQIYCFTSTTVWAEYESIQSDIFDHLHAVLPTFALRAYQAPSGSDFHNIKLSAPAADRSSH
jgi:miniconductance mechanosensitive channel